VFKLANRAGLAVAIVAMTTTGVMAGPSKKPAKPAVNSAATPFTITTYDGQRVSLEDLKGKVVVLNYWATWCAPCRGEMIVMDNYMRAHPKTDLRIYAVTVESNVPARFMRPLAAALSFPLGTRFTGRDYGIIQGALPSSYVIGRDGVVRYAANGAFDKQSFEELLTPLLAEPSPAGQ
jgi:thiol-disulfide isomerase/thioredoxin